MTPTVRRYPRSLSEAFPQVRAYWFENEHGHAVSGAAMAYDPTQLARRTGSRCVHSVIETDRSLLARLYRWLRKWRRA